ncbi:MAG TPA: MarR family transcriptional regulator [Azospirillaceae bacterium]|nr:MarR family transcriptional regulator [Azospirillaceae bacterium]
MLELDTFLPYRLNVLAKRISRDLARRYEAQFGLSIPEWRVIAILGQRQPLSSNDIVERTQMDKAKVSRAVNRLVQAGLLERATHPEDQRLLRLSFTDAGRDLYDRLSPQALAWERQLLEALAPEEAAQLHALIDRLNSRLDEMG